MLLHYVLELLCSVILATDTSWHSASLNLGSAESRHSRGGRRVGRGTFDQCLGAGDRKTKWNVDRTDHTRQGPKTVSCPAAHPSVVHIRGNPPFRGGGARWCRV